MKYFLTLLVVFSLGCRAEPRVDLSHQGGTNPLPIQVSDHCSGPETGLRDVGTEADGELVSYYDLNPADQDQVYQDQVYQDQILQDQILQDQILQDQILQDQILQDQVLQDQVLQDQVLQDQILQDQIYLDQLYVDEVSQPDLDASETPDWIACLPGEGCFLEPCLEDMDCREGLCTLHIGELVCSQACEQGCPGGWSCDQALNLCLSDTPRLGLPCLDDQDCRSLDEEPSFCLDYGDSAGFCGSDCRSEACPPGFICDFEDLDLSDQAQCRAEDPDWTCTGYATRQHLLSRCRSSNRLGSCPGTWTCLDDGPGACNARVPAADLCNGLDDDCDGQVDELPCDDGDPCTGGDSCVSAVCTGYSIGCECRKDEDCPEDGDLCNGTMRCDTSKLPYLCVVEPQTVVICPPPDPEGKDSPCLVPWCQPQTGACSLVPGNPGLPCDDQDLCTSMDSCREGHCLGDAVVCDDGNPCTTDSCDPATGCSFADNSELCDDQDLCTENDQCMQGECVGEAVACLDGNPCTDDGCDPKLGCLFVPNSNPCDDLNHCTLGDVCLSGLCLGGPAPDCNDGNPCTDDLCEPLVGCLSSWNALPCDDQDPCTVTDTCVQGSCVGAGTPDCDDHNPCTDDGCLEKVGCITTPNSLECDDGDLCTMGDRCLDGSCSSGTPLVCDDGNPCTSDSCLADSGCVFAPDNGADCDDGDPCTANYCEAGACLVSETWECSEGCDTCRPDQGCIEHRCVVLAGNSCSDPIWMEELPFNHVGNTMDAADTYQVQAGVCSGVDSGLGTDTRDQVFTLVAPHTISYGFELYSMFPASFYVVRDCDQLSTSCLGGRTSDWHTFFELDLTQGDQVFVIVDGDDSGSLGGEFQLRVSITGCLPNCIGMSCNDDGCGGTCECAAGGLCQPNGYCCFPDCGDRTCGDDGCGGSCGSCPEDQPCWEGNCCTPDCDGTTCGDDGCGGKCTCADSSTRCVDGLCCQPFCPTNYCGDDGCGEDCSCTGDTECIDGNCCLICGDRLCGDDYCGGTCGECGPGEICGSDAKCCMPHCYPGAECGDDGCEGNCGVCPEGSFCSDDEKCCKLECVGKACGEDGCVDSCSYCPFGRRCKNGVCS